MYKLENDVPYTEKSPIGNPWKYPFKNMEIGQSFWVPPERNEVARVAVARWKQSHPGWNYISQTENGGRRIWRTG